jgi:hypothetical protein
LYILIIVVMPTLAAIKDATVMALAALRNLKFVISALASTDFPARYRRRTPMRQPTLLTPRPK